MESSRARTIADLPERFNAACDLLDHNVAVRPAKVAVIDRDGPTTYGELADRVAAMAAVFAGLGLRREQRVLLCLLDTVDFPTVFLGAIRAGIVAIPLNTLLVADDYRWILQNSDAAAVFVSEELAPQWSGFAGEFPDVRFVSSGGGPWPKLDEMLVRAREAERLPPADTHRDDVAFWLYTSGSTGRPKGAMHSHASMRLTANLFGIGVVGYREDDVILSVAKQFFAYGLGNALSFPYAAGATVILYDGRATPAAIGRLIVEHQVTILNGVPRPRRRACASPPRRANACRRTSASNFSSATAPT